MSWAKLALGRVLLFGMFAIDALMQIRHAPRYGAGGFNVAQLPLLDGLGPTRGSYGVCELLNAYLFVLAACGVATRLVVPAAAAIYAWLYFGSQLDSYQHHYLVSLLLLLACFVPWQRPAGATARTPVRAWALRLVLLQLAIMYLWAAISKMSPAWLDGRTLAGQIGGPMRGLVDSTIGVRATARLVLLVELALAATVWIRPAWWVAAPLGLGFHLSIVFSKLEIGLFAWLMIALYAFVVPDAIWIAIAELPPVQTALRVVGIVTGYFREGARWLVWGLALAVGIALAAASRFDHALAVGLVLAAVPIAALVVRRVRPGAARAHIAWLSAAHLLAFTTWTIVDRTTTVAPDYYRFWGGSSRRLHDTAAAEHAYRRLVEVAPDESTGHYQLGRLLLARGADEEGLAELRAAQRLEPTHARSFVAEARWLAEHGRRDEAIAKAREALAAEPGNADARGLLEALTGRSRAPAPPPDDAHDEPEPR
ncbi:MAG: HTTM domain-containing protein [Acidobacteriota bacterium]